MEKWDVYDINREKTGRTVIRDGEMLKKGEFHLVVHLCVFDSKGEMLIQHRQPFKKGWPNMWDLTVGGSALQGEDAQTAITREAHEELGLNIDFSDVLPNMTVYFENGFDDIFLIKKDIEISELTFQPEEVQNAKWAKKEEILSMISDGTFIPYSRPFIELLFDRCGHYGCHAAD